MTLGLNLINDKDTVAFCVNSITKANPGNGTTIIGIIKMNIAILTTDEIRLDRGNSQSDFTPISQCLGSVL